MILVEVTRKPLFGVKFGIEALPMPLKRAGGYAVQLAETGKYSQVRVIDTDNGRTLYDSNERRVA